VPTKTYSVSIDDQEDGPLVEWLDGQDVKQPALLTALRYYHRHVVDRADDSGYLFVALNPATMAVRIGFTRQPERVLKPLSSYAGIKLEMQEVIPVNDASEVDNLKRYLEWHEYRAIGNWFAWEDFTKRTIERLKRGERLQTIKADG
jgi:hypothetical protein